MVKKLSNAPKNGVAAPAKKPSGKKSTDHQLVQASLIAKAQQLNIPFSLNASDEIDAGIVAASGESIDADVGSREVKNAINKQIERALLSIKQGVYGICQVCQKEIPIGRLEAIPEATECTPCAKLMESSPQSDRTDRPLPHQIQSEVEYIDMSRVDK